MPEKKRIRVILVTDGDLAAQRAIEDIGEELKLRCISASGGNPTPISGEEIVGLLKKVPYDPVLVMFDDRGKRGKDKGEWALETVATHPDIEVLGALAVASNTSGIRGIHADVCIDSAGRVLKDAAVDKNGDLRNKSKTTPLICGDTVDVLNDVKIKVPVIVGIGDIGKMDKADDIKKGAPITKKAIEEILRRSGISNGKQDTAGAKAPSERNKQKH